MYQDKIPPSFLEVIENLSDYQRKIRKKYGEAILDYYRTTGQLPPQESDINKTVTLEDQIRFIAKWERENLTEKPIQYIIGEPFKGDPSDGALLGESSHYQTKDLPKKHSRSIIKLRGYKPSSKNFKEYINTLSHELYHVPQSTKEIEENLQPRGLGTADEPEHFGVGTNKPGQESTEWLIEKIKERKKQYLKNAPKEKANFVKYLQEVEGYPREIIADKPIKSPRAKPKTTAKMMPKESWQGTPEETLDFEKYFEKYREDNTDERFKGFVDYLRKNREDNTDERFKKFVEDLRKKRQKND